MNVSMTLHITVCDCDMTLECKLTLQHLLELTGLHCKAKTNIAIHYHIPLFH